METSTKTLEYDVIIIGGGHAGCEAANIASKLKSKTLLISQNLQTIGEMSCNVKLIFISLLLEE